MPRVFLLTSAGGPTGAETQARLALAALPHFPHESAASVGPFDFSLQERIRAFRPDVLHAVGPTAGRAALALKLPRVGLTPCPRLVLSGCDPTDGWLVRRALRRADAVIAYSPGEAVRYREWVKPERVEAVPMGGPVCRDTEGSAGVFRAPFRVAANPDILIAAVGNFDRRSGLKTAVWAFDVLKYIDPRFHLLLIGDGPNRAAVDAFGRSLGFDDYRVRFAGHSDRVPELLADAAVTWVTHDRGGMNVALESMAAGTPVVAMRTTDTASVIAHGDTGVLVPFGDRVALASATAALLGRADELKRLGEAARRAVADRFPVGALADATARVYAD